MDAKAVQRRDPDEELLLLLRGSVGAFHGRSLPDREPNPFRNILGLRHERPFRYSRTGSALLGTPRQREQGPKNMH